MVGDIELMNLDTKRGCLEFLIKASLHRTPVVVLLMMMKPVSNEGICILIVEGRQVTQSPIGLLNGDRARRG